jgi:hypothetical protein
MRGEGPITQSNSGGGRRSLRLPVALALVLGLVAFPATAGATVGTVTMSGGVNPAPIDATSSGVSLSFGFDATYSGGFDPVPSSTDFHFDNDIGFDTPGEPQCAPASITNVSTATALSVCGAAKVGGGSVLYNSGALSGVVTAFNGTPSGGHDRILIHIEIPAGPMYLLLTGELGPSSRGGDYGTQINITDWPHTSGLAATHFAVTLDNLEPTDGHHYVSARCGDSDRLLDFAADLSYWDASTRAATITQACASIPPAVTGERAKALKKCKKKHSKKARKKCRKKARRLPA